MIVCSNCESAQMLQITQSRVYFGDGQEVTELSESYECTMCGAEGRYKYEKSDERGVTAEVTITGDVEQTDEEPRVSP